jgi:competence protein ComEC
VAVLLVDPWLSRAAGFRLSVLATGALVLCTVPWSRALGRVAPRPVALAVAVPAAAQVAVTPVLVGLEPVVSLYALPANMLAAPAVAPATVLGLLASLLSLVHGGLAALVAVPARWCAAWIAGVGRRSADLPWASVPVPEGLLGAALAGGGSGSRSCSRPWCCVRCRTGARRGRRGRRGRA